MLIRIGLCYLLTIVAASAAGNVPAVNTDMGCTTTGQALSYNGSTIVCQAPQRPTSTIGNLPTCNAGTQGAMYFVTDALLPAALATVGAGGAVKVGVTCNGSAWIVQ
jgi:hypothetical protein